MFTLHFGVIDLPYSFRVPVAKRGKRKGKRPSGGQTTGDVAVWLENKYHIMEHFYQLKAQKIADACAKSLEGALENMALGAPPVTNPLQGAMSDVEASFKKFLASREIERQGYPGIPTQAALSGVNHRLSIKKGGRRPSFIDTGLYQSSFKAWAD